MLYFRCACKVYYYYYLEAEQVLSEGLNMTCILAVAGIYNPSLMALSVSSLEIIFRSDQLWPASLLNLTPTLLIRQQTLLHSANFLIQKHNKTRRSLKHPALVLLFTDVALEPCWGCEVRFTYAHAGVRSDKQDQEGTREAIALRKIFHTPLNNKPTKFLDLVIL